MKIEDFYPQDKPIKAAALDVFRAAADLICHHEFDEIDFDCASELLVLSLKYMRDSIQRQKELGKHDNL